MADKHVLLYKTDRLQSQLVAESFSFQPTNGSDTLLRGLPDNCETVPCAPRRAALCVLASGSRGNAVYVSDGDCAILIDAGLSGREIERRLRSRGLSPESLRAIVVSHEHSDHVQGVGVLSRRWSLPVYISRKTAAGTAIGRLYRRRHFACGTSFQIDSLRIHPFSLSHDAADPSGFTIAGNGWKIGIATDLGCVTAMVRHHLGGCRALVLEANHDPDMLLRGPYPWPLKQRIRARTGHLSNTDSGALLGALRHAGLRQVVLAHLSETNNTPEKAFQAVAPFLENYRVQLHVAVQDRCGELLKIEQEIPPGTRSFDLRQTPAGPGMLSSGSNSKGAFDSCSGVQKPKPR